VKLTKVTVIHKKKIGKGNFLGGWGVGEPFIWGRNIFWRGRGTLNFSSFPQDGTLSSTLIKSQVRHDGSVRED